jgi:hypothetical protein
MINYLENPILDGKDGDVKGAAPEVIDEDVLLPRDLLVEAVGNGRGCWLIDDAEDVEAGNNPGIL